MTRVGVSTFWNLIVEGNLLSVIDSRQMPLFSMHRFLPLQLVFREQVLPRIVGYRELQGAGRWRDLVSV